VHHTALAGVRLDRDEIRRAPRTRYLGQLDALGGKRGSGYHSEELEADMEQSGGHRSGDKPPQARRVDARVTMWLGDGEAKRGEVLSGEYKLVISAREP